MDKNEIITIFHIAENYLNEKYDLRLNTISLVVEISIRGKFEWEVLNDNSLWLEMQKKSIKIPHNSLLAILRSNFVNKYNPIKNYFYNLPKWDQKTDYIKKFSEYVILADGESKDQFEYHFKKWCVRTVKCALIENYFNKQAFILSDDGNGQNIGKTTWTRALCPPILADYIAQNLPENEKDARILLAKNFLIILDELDSLSRKDINKLKSYFTIDKINERLPYDRKNSIIFRISSFIGSTNMSTFLHDETGSVRWLCFIVKNINWNYRDEFNVDNLWAQAYHLSLDKSFNSEMTNEDVKNNELRNDKFQIITPEMDFIKKHFGIPKSNELAEFFTATDVLNHINIYSYGIRFNPNTIGRTIKKLGFKRVKHNQVYGYWITKLTI